MTGTVESTWSRTPVRSQSSRRTRRIPAVVVDLAERAAVDDDPRPARPERLELRPAAVPEPRPEVRPGRRQDVGVDVDAIEGHGRLRGSPAWAAA